MVGRWVFGTAMGLLSLIGLFLASNSVDDGMYLVGLLFFLFGVLFIFTLIGKSVGAAHRQGDHAEDAGKS